MAGADTDTLAVQDRSEVVRVHILECEAHHSAPLADGGSVDAQPFDLGEPRLGERHEAPLVGEYPVHSDPLEVGDGGRETNRASGVRSSRLELVRQHVPGRPVVVNELDHVSATLVGRHLFEELAPADKPAESHWPEHLVAAESVEVDPHLIDTDGKVRSALGAVANGYRGRTLPHEPDYL